MKCLLILFLFGMCCIASILSCPERCMCGLYLTNGASPQYITDCSNRGFTSVPSDVEEKTVVLRLNGNKITTLEANSFTNLKKLESLDLSSNKITTIHEGSLSLVNIKSIDLKNNLLPCSCSLWKLLNKTGAVFHAGCFQNGKAINFMEESIVCGKASMGASTSGISDAELPIGIVVGIVVAVVMLVVVTLVLVHCWLKNRSKNIPASNQQVEVGKEVPNEQGEDATTIECSNAEKDLGVKLLV